MFEELGALMGLRSVLFSRDLDGECVPSVGLELASWRMGEPSLEGFAEVAAEERSEYNGVVAGRRSVGDDAERVEVLRPESGPS